MDKYAFAQNMSVISTVSDRVWSLKVNQISVKTQDLLKEGQRLLVSFDPSMPFIYIPDHQWDLMAIELDYLYDKINCNNFKGLCAFESPCD